MRNDEQPAEPREPAGERVTTPVEGAPSDNTTLMWILDDLAAAGFAGQLVVGEDATATAPAGSGVVECVACGKSSAPEELEVHAVRRLEGASDPADMLLVVAATCPRCGTAGTLVSGFGPNATAAEAAVVRALRTRGPGV